MIARLTGTPVARTADGIVLDVGGVGYSLRVTDRAHQKAKEGREVTFDTYLHVREDVLQLYGFAEPAERELFEQLLSVSGVGPKVALLIVSGSTPAELRKAIVLGDITRFVAIPGVGKKTAERIVLELKDRVSKLGVEPEEAAATASPGDRLRDDLLSALQNLGYHRPLAEKAADAALAAGGDPTFEVALKAALRELMRNR